MATIRLTDLAIRTLPEGVYFDERTPSFGLLERYPINMYRFRSRRP